MGGIVILLVIVPATVIIVVDIVDIWYRKQEPSSMPVIHAPSYV